jgi:hypothetical protein
MHWCFLCLGTMSFLGQLLHKEKDQAIQQSIGSRKEYETKACHDGEGKIGRCSLGLEWLLWVSMAKFVTWLKVITLITQGLNWPKWKDGKNITNHYDQGW